MSIKNFIVQKALNTMRIKVLNPKIADIAKINSIEWKDGKLYLTAILNGLEDRLIHVQCNKVKISDDDSTVTLSDFVSDMPFIENALNCFAAKSYPLPKEGMLGFSIGIVKKILGI